MIIGGEKNKWYEVPVEMTFHTLMPAKDFNRASVKKDLQHDLIESLMEYNKIHSMMRGGAVHFYEHGTVRVEPEGYVYHFEVVFQGFTFGVGSYLKAKFRWMRSLLSPKSQFLDE